MRLLSRLGHLAGRFFEVLGSRPLGPREQREAAALLRTAEHPIFWRQPAVDQRHGLECARAVLRLTPGRRDLARAALLHDVGKRHAGIGVIRRSLASGLELVRLPAPGRLGLYLTHGELGARELAEAGAEELVVEFARSHHQERPASIPAEAWQTLRSVNGE
ncbi:MAG: HD domain-containing protein [Acidimicrobiia bacterium]